MSMDLLDFNIVVEFFENFQNYINFNESVGGDLRGRDLRVWFANENLFYRKKR